MREDLTMLFPEEQTQATKFRVFAYGKFRYFNSLDKIEKCFSKSELKEILSIESISVVYRCEVLGYIKNPFI